MIRDKSLENIDLKKLTIYAFVLVLICGILILVLLIPLFKNYQHLSLRLASQNTINTYANTKLQISQNKLNNLIDENNITLNHFQNEFTVEDFNKFLEQNLENLILEEQEPNEEKYLIKQFHVNAQIKDQNALFNFIKNLNEYKNVVKIDFPLNLKSKKNKIEIDFILKVFSSKTIQK